MAGVASCKNQQEWKQDDDNTEVEASAKFHACHRPIPRAFILTPAGPVSNCSGGRLPRLLSSRTDLEANFSLYVLSEVCVSITLYST